MGELHRLLNNRKGSVSATKKKNAEANDRAYDLNQKTFQALDALAEEYAAFEVTITKVTSEDEASDVLYAVADELERTWKDQDRAQDDLDSSCEDLAAATREFSNCWVAHEATSAKLCSAIREV